MSSLTRLPSLEEMYRKRPSFTRPPVRAVNSPRLTDEEADQLTSPFLNYSTGYTYAFSQAYNPDRPPAWEVPNINNNLLHIESPEYVPYHFSAPSLLCKNGMAVIGMVRNAVFWLLHLITIRLMKGLGLLFYNIIESTFCLMDLTINAFRKFQGALKRSYYERLEEKANEINKRAVLSKIEEIKRLEVEARRFLAEVQTRRAARARGELVDDYDGGQGSNHESGNNRYNLRRRMVTADTDSEDDISRNKENASFGLSKGLLPLSGKSQHHGTYRIATWLGSTASSSVYYMLYVVHLLTVSVKKSYDGMHRVLSYFVPTILLSTARASPILRSKAGRRGALHSRVTYLTRSTVSFDEKPSEQTVSPIVAQFKSLCFSILYTPSRAFLFIVFAGADLLRWMYSRRHRWVWWLLPFFLLFLFFYYGTNHGVTILGRDGKLSELQEKVSNYAQSFVDPDAVHAKSLNSIYDEYWRSGKLYRHSIIWRITTVASNSYFFLVNVFESTFSLIYASVRGLLSFILDFFAVYGREAYSLLTTVPLLSFPNLSEALSTTQMLHYFTNATDLAPWKSSGVFASTEQHFYKIFTLFSNVGTMLLTGLSDLFFMLSNGVYTLFILIENSFHRTLVAVVDQQQTYLEPKPNMDLINSDVNPNVCIPSLAPAIDEAKLVDKISAVVRAQMDQDFKTKVEKELKALSAIYDEKLSKLELDKKQVDIDYSRLESIIRSAILEYDSDKTGMFDFALESAGPVGYITIGLSHAINVTLISYEHIGAHQAPAGQRPSAPKTFKIWAYKSENDMATRVLLGDFMYDLKASPLQFFVVKTQPGYPVKIIEMEVTSNYGAEYTSLYRLRVHGSLYKSGDI
ncbi:unnamed protein product [Angiostrongylus costaricensis]|uniref:SUN domain-containing protein n=1 Tax=Angiostrongylus costaricensis TaxID=334426 RepID=A0A158PDD2_ANGCS|nr:unnamed protein product [Angiostrongylus costaricensis]